MHRFIGKFNLLHKDLLITDKALLHQIRDVLKLKVGEQIVLCDGEGIEGVGKIISFKGGVNVFVEEISNTPPSASKVILFCAILKKENFEWVAQKATEVGVSEIVPMITRRTVKTNLNLLRLRKITHEASEQSGRISVPVVSEPMTLSEAWKHAQDCDTKWICDASGDLINRKNSGSVAVFIGPEGGWDDDELQMAREHGFEVTRLGKNILRAETAAVIGAYLSVN